PLAVNLSEAKMMLDLKINIPYGFYGAKING
ncbi:unnamed protein product, partial [marine sediment metagenome]